MITSFILCHQILPLFITCLLHVCVCANCGKCNTEMWKEGSASLQSKEVDYYESRMKTDISHKNPVNNLVWIESFLLFQAILFSREEKN
jgi:hypothetical protein